MCSPVSGGLSCTMVEMEIGDDALPRNNARYSFVTARRRLLGLFFSNPTLDRSLSKRFPVSRHELNILVPTSLDF